MKFFKLKKQKASSEITIGESGVPEYTNPIREWTIGLSIAIIVFISGGVLIGLDFYGQFVAPEETVDIKDGVQVYRSKEVLYYTDIYTKREELFNQLRVSTVTEAEVATGTTEIVENIQEEPEDIQGESTDVAEDAPTFVPLADQ